MEKLYQVFLESIFNDEKNIKKRIHVAGAVIVQKKEDGKKYVLLIQRAADDHWPLHVEIPRGKCDDGPNETLEHCLKREVKEETGLDVTPISFIDKFSYIADKGTRKSTQYNFLCKMNNPNQKIKLSSEHDDYIWISTVGEAELFTLPEIKKTITKVLNVDDKIVDYPQSQNVETNIKEYLRKIR